MGWGFRTPWGKGGLKGAIKGLVYSGGGVLPGLGEVIAGSDKAESIMNQVGGGIGNLVTGGMISQNKATEEAKKARDQAKKQYDAETAAAQAEAERLANLEEERKKRLALYGNQMPATLMGSYTGLPGGATVSRATLG